jgi:hypothetical protein
MDVSPIIIHDAVLRWEAVALEVPESVNNSLDAWSQLIKQSVKRGDLVVVDWLDAADERQVISVKPDKVPTPVTTIGLYYDVIVRHLCIIGHLFSEKWKDMTYIPVGMITRIEVRGDGLRERLVSNKTWTGHAHTRKVRFGKKTRSIHSAKVKKVLAEAPKRD